MGNVVIVHTDSDTKGEFTAEAEGRTAGKMTYSKAGSRKIIIDHTEIDEDMKGTGLGKKLVEYGVTWARKNKIVILPLCPFAKSMIERNPEWQDVIS